VLDRRLDLGCLQLGGAELEGDVRLELTWRRLAQGATEIRHGRVGRAAPARALGCVA
jgi:hypothetical protein